MLIYRVYFLALTQGYERSLIGIYQKAIAPTEGLQSDFITCGYIFVYSLSRRLRFNRRSPNLIRRPWSSMQGGSLQVSPERSA